MWRRETDFVGSEAMSLASMKQYARRSQLLSGFGQLHSRLEPIDNMQQGVSGTAGTGLPSVGLGVKKTTNPGEAIGADGRSCGANHMQPSAGQGRPCGTNFPCINITRSNFWLQGRWW